MPSDKVQFQYEQIEQIARSTNGYADTAAAMRQRLAQHMQSLMDGGWVGEGADTFFGEMEQYMFPAVVRLERALEALSGVLIQACDVMREAEEEAANRFRVGDGGLTSGGGNGASGGGSAGGGSPGGGTAGGGSATANLTIADKIKLVGKIFGVTDNAFKMLENLGQAASKWGGKLKWAGPVGDALGLIGSGIQAFDSPNGIETFGEKLTGFGLEKAISAHPVGLAVVLISDVNQLVGTGASFAAGQLNEGINDPRLGESISRFDGTLKNADLGNVLDGVGAVAVDLVQAHIGGVQQVFSNPTPLTVMQALTPGGFMAVGLSDTGRLSELGRNTLITLGHTADFAIGAVTMGPAFVDLAENSMRVGMHNAGFSSGFSETASSIFGDIASSTMTGVPFAGQLFDLMGSGPKIDLSDMATSLFN